MKLLMVPKEWSQDAILWINPQSVNYVSQYDFGQGCAVRINRELISLTCTAAEFVAWLNGGAA